MEARLTSRFLLLLCALWLSACSAPAAAAVPSPMTSASPTAIAATLHAFTTTVALTPVPTSARLNIAVTGSVPKALVRALKLQENVRILSYAGQADLADLRLDVLSGRAGQPTAAWVYALVAPFPTVADGVDLSEIKAAWQGKPGVVFKTAPLLVSAETLAAFDRLWGPAAPARVKVLPTDELSGTAWNSLPSWALIPFEDLNPRWKVLRIANQSPLDKAFSPESYPLTIYFGLIGASVGNQAASILPDGNRDPEKLTVLVMTGTTALTREIAEKMEEKGVNYPAGGIGAWLRDADLTHISNEVSFYKDCPAPARRPPNFCSDPAYIELLRTVGTDIVELTGNHLLDWGPQPFLNTLEMYAQQGWAVYGGGRDLASARAPVTLTDHGNKLAFIGCNPSGPESDWATKNTPGAASCDFDAMTKAVQSLVTQGYLVIATFQHVEVCRMEPHLTQQADFGKLVKAGAVIVSGSQAHCPQAMAFTGSQFVHYGLGNLFFDQMDDFSRQQFIDRHVFYDGRYISTELLTAKLEDYARPRPMTPAERQKLLEDAFRASGWIP